MNDVEFLQTYNPGEKHRGYKSGFAKCSLVIRLNQGSQERAVSQRWFPGSGFETFSATYLLRFF